MTRLLPFHPIYGGRWFLRRATYSTAKVDYIFATPPTNFPILGIFFLEIFRKYFGNIGIFWIFLQDPLPILPI